MSMATKPTTDDEGEWRKYLEAQYGDVWDTDQVQELFEVLGFCQGIVSVKRRSDGADGTMRHTHHPRFYFDFAPYQDPAKVFQSPREAHKEAYPEDFRARKFDGGPEHETVSRKRPDQQKLHGQRKEQKRGQKEGQKAVYEIAW